MEGSSRRKLGDGPEPAAHGRQDVSAYAAIRCCLLNRFTQNSWHTLIFIWVINSSIESFCFIIAPLLHVTIFLQYTISIFIHQELVLRLCLLQNISIDKPLQYPAFYREFPAVKKGIFEGDGRYFYYIINIPIKR